MTKYLALLLVLVSQVAFSHDMQKKLALIKTAKQSIVGVGIYNPLGAPRYQLRGTGFVVKTTNNNETFIATNHHVVNGAEFDKAKSEISIHVGEGKNALFYKAELVAQDERSDVAIVKIKAHLPTISLAAPKYAAPAGSEIFIAGLPIGSVLGFYKSVHTGYVAAYVPMAIPQNSASQLTIEVIKQLRNPLFVYQLDATAYPGNSGSPVVDSETGNVIAILNSVKVKSTKEHVLSDPSGISYAIPVEHIWALLPQ